MPLEIGSNSWSSVRRASTLDTSNTVLMREEYSLTEDSEKATFGCLILETCNLLMYHILMFHLSFQPNSALVATCCYQLVWMPHEGVFLRKWLQNLHIVQYWQTNAAAHSWS